MLRQKFSANKNFLIGSILTGLIISIFAIAPQIDLWMNCENKCHGIYAITVIDEPFYAAYLQSLMDGKPRRNSPISGAVDSETTPQKESSLSIQFLASYPLVFLAKVFNLSISELMIVISLLTGFFSAFAVYWLIYHFTNDNISAFVGTIAVIFLGSMFGGQGATFSLFSSEGIQVSNNLIFLRRVIPAIGVPALFLFIIFVCRLFSADSSSAKLKSAFFAICAFTFCVYTYFYFWTTAVAWCFGLILLLGLFHFEKLKENLRYLIGFGILLVLILIPYFILVSNREINTDAVISLTFTHEPDLWRLPEIASYIITILILIFTKFRVIDLKDPKIIFLLSLNLVTIIVFNQQIITGRSIQPFHYQFYCVNYFVAFSSFLLFFILLKKVIKSDKSNLLMVALVYLPLFVGGFDTFESNNVNRELNLYRDKFVPMSERIKTITQNPEFQANNKESVVLSFDYGDPTYLIGTDIPALTSQPILWGLHLNLMINISPKENITRLNYFLYYQNVSKDQLKSQFFQGVGWEAISYLGEKYTPKLLTGKDPSFTNDDVNKAVGDYDSFCQNFSYEDAKKHLISLVLVNKTRKNDFTNLDRWYERDAGEVVGDYILYRVKLRQP